MLVVTFMKKTLFLLILPLLIITLGGNAMAMTLTSPAFKNGEAIPTENTCSGDDRSPELNWTSVPAKAKSLALIVDDPDAPVGTWVHWVLYDLPADEGGIPEDVTSAETMPNGAKQGINDFKKVGYGGPCPPPGKPHRYFFKLYALDATLKLAPKATKAQVEAAMKGHIVEKAELMGTFGR